MREQNQKLKKTGTIHDTVTGYDFRVDKPLSPRRAIRVCCLDCCAGSSLEVKKCPCYSCGNWPYRLGHGVTKDPEGKVMVERERSDAQKAADARNADRLLAMRTRG